MCYYFTMDKQKSLHKYPLNGKVENKESKRPTIKDVAEAAGVSIATVSYVLNNKPGQSISEQTRKKILQFANILGYKCNVMAKYLASGKLNLLSVVIKDIHPFASAYYLKLIAELSRLMYAEGLSLRIDDYSDSMLRGSDCDAIITIGLSEADFKTLAETKFIPVIALDSILDDFLFYQITDDFAALKAAACAALNTNDISLLTFSLPECVLKRARATFDDVIIITTLEEVAALDTTKCYATVSSSVYDNAKLSTNVYLSEGSYSRKAAALFKCAQFVIDKNSLEEHDVCV